MKFKVGDKVVPHSKTTGVSLDKCNNWKRAKNHNQHFLYVVSVGSKEYLLSYWNDSAGGSYYNESDLTLYTEEHYTINEPIPMNVNICASVEPDPEDKDKLPEWCEVGVMVFVDNTPVSKGMAKPIQKINKTYVEVAGMSFGYDSVKKYFAPAKEVPLGKDDYSKWDLGSNALFAKKHLGYGDNIYHISKVTDSGLIITKIDPDDLDGCISIYAYFSQVSKIYTKPDGSPLTKWVIDEDKLKGGECNE